MGPYNIYELHDKDGHIISAFFKTLEEAEKEAWKMLFKYHEIGILEKSLSKLGYDPTAEYKETIVKTIKE